MGQKVTMNTQNIHPVLAQGDGPFISLVERKGMFICLMAFLFILSQILLSSCVGPNVKIPANVTHVVHEKEVKPFVPATYRVGPSDELEIFYLIDPVQKVKEYRVDTGDELRVEFYYYPIMNYNVKVRPDGQISVPLIGEMDAAGLTPKELRENLEKAFQPHLLRSKVTVDLIKFNVKTEELMKAIYSQDRGQARLVVVRPDGAISLPFIGDRQAAGYTPAELGGMLEESYRKYIAQVSIKVAVSVARSNKCYILGEVTRPNFYDLPQPTTLTQLISMAGGFSREANTHQVVVISRSEEGKPEARVIDMDSVIGEGNIGADIPIKQYDVVFIPRTKLATAALSGEQLWRLIPFSFSVSGTYSLGGSAPR